jgi:hypothetical protein
VIEIGTRILTENDIDYLEFVFARDDVVRVNINDATDSTALKSVFNRIIKLSLESEVKLKDLEVDPSMTKALLIDVFGEYVTDLNQEVTRIRAEIRASETDDE